jgi:hypothetical protein
MSRVKNFQKDLEFTFEDPSNTTAHMLMKMFPEGQLMACIDESDKVISPVEVHHFLIKFNKKLPRNNDLFETILRVLGFSKKVFDDSPMTVIRKSLDKLVVFQQDGTVSYTVKFWKYYTDKKGHYYEVSTAKFDK